MLYGQSLEPCLFFIMGDVYMLKFLGKVHVLLADQSIPAIFKDSHFLTSEVPLCKIKFNEGNVVVLG
jgi:hypothetical protein